MTASNQSETKKGNETMTKKKMIADWRKLIAKLDENNERYCAGAYGRDEWQRLHDDNMATYDKLQPHLARAK